MADFQTLVAFPCEGRAVPVETELTASATAFSASFAIGSALAAALVVLAVALDREQCCVGFLKSASRLRCDSAS